MLTYTRIETIKKELKSNGFVSYEYLSSLFPDVSTMTLRRDIERLESEGIAVKVRGGAKYLTESDKREDVYSLRAVRNIAAKQKIAEKALKYIDTGRSVYLDSGSTIMEFAKTLPDIRLSVITSGPNIALELIKRKKPNVNLIGGTLNPDNCSLAGPIALYALKNYNIDIAFVAPSGFTNEIGFTVGNFAESEVKKTVIKKANKVIMLMDKEKVGKNLPFTFANLKNIDVIITDCDIDNNLLSEAKNQNVEIIKV